MCYINDNKQNQRLTTWGWRFNNLRNTDCLIFLHGLQTSGSSAIPVVCILSFVLASLELFSAEKVWLEEPALIFSLTDLLSMQFYQQNRKYFAIEILLRKNHSDVRTDCTNTQVMSATPKEIVNTAGAKNHPHGTHGTVCFKVGSLSCGRWIYIYNIVFQRLQHLGTFYGEAFLPFYSYNPKN